MTLEEYAALNQEKLYQDLQVMLVVLSAVPSYLRYKLKEKLGLVE